jgi:hypothetical protein
MKPVVLIIVIALIGGLVVGAGMTGMVNIPGLTPAKKKAGAAAVYASDKDKAEASEKAPAKGAPPQKVKPKVPPPKVAAKETAPSLDPSLGYKKVAKLWNAMEADKIKVQIAKGWKDAELACIFNKMDTGKVAEVLALLEPAKATKLTKAIQAEASKLAAPAAK